MSKSKSPLKDRFDVFVPLILYTKSYLRREIIELPYHIVQEHIVKKLLKMQPTHTFVKVSEVLKIEM